MARINLDSTPVEAATAMAEGNPGAISVIAQLLGTPMGIIALCHLDDAEIYGSNIWVLYKDVCKQDITKFNELCFSGNLKEELKKATP